MSANLTPALQLTIVDPNQILNPNPLQSGGIPLYCASGVSGERATLPAATSSLALAFPAGVTTATVIFIAAITTTDLIVNVGSGSPVALNLPLGQGMFLYNLTSSHVSISSALGGQILYSVGG